MSVQDVFRVENMMSVIPFSNVIKNISFKCEQQCVNQINLTEIRVYFNYGFVYGYFLSILQFLICGKCLKMVYEDGIENNSVVFIKILPPEDANEIEPFYITEKYLVEIVSGVKILKDKSLLSFNKLFDPEIWLLLTLSSIVITILMSKLSSSQNHGKYAMEVLRTLTTQSEVKIIQLKNLRHFTNRFQFIIILLVLLFFTNFITKCFTSLLLNSYFERISVPFIETLEQLLINKDNFYIAAKDNSFGFINRTGILTEKQVDLIYERKQIYQKMFDFDFSYPLAILDETIFNDMINGLAVILLNGFDADVFRAQYISQSNEYFISDHKYVLQFGTHWVMKESPILKELSFVFKQVLETGLNIHHESIEKIIKHIEQLEKYRLLGDLLKETEHGKVSDNSLQIKFNEFFRNDLMVLIFGICLSVFLIICEVLYLYLWKASQPMNKILLAKSEPQNLLLGYKPARFRRKRLPISKFY